MRLLLRKNASRLFPTIKPQDPSRNQRRPRDGIRRSRAQTQQRLWPQEVDLTRISAHFKHLGKGLEALLHSLNEFPEFYDETLNANCTTFHKDLKVSITSFTLFPS